MSAPLSASSVPAGASAAGIGMLPTPDPAASSSSPPPCPFEETRIEGKGRGLRATRAIRQGDVLLEEEALLIVPHSAEPDAVERMVLALLAPQQAIFHALHAHMPQPSDASVSRASAILRTNGMRVVLPGRPATGIFPRAALLNHACDANVHHVWSAQAQRMRIIARRDVEAGEELLTNYTDALGTRAERRERMQSDYGFECACPICSLSGAELEASDERRARLFDLEQSILRALLSREYAECISLVEQRLALLEELWHAERVRAPYTASRSCWDACEAARAMGDAAATRTWAERTMHFTRLAEGTDERNPTMLQCRELLRQMELEVKA